MHFTSIIFWGINFLHKLCKAYYNYKKHVERLDRIRWLIFEFLRNVENSLMLEIASNSAATALPPTSCRSDRELDKVNGNLISSTSRSCSCYTDLCNSEENDFNSPQLITGDVNCISQECTSHGCKNITESGRCKGQYCVIGNQIKNQQIYYFIFPGANTEKNTLKTVV